MEIRKLLKLSKREYYRTHLSLINCVIPKALTPKEIEVLAAFMSLEGDIAQLRFGPTAKKIVMEQVNIKPAGLSNYLTSLLERGFLIKRGDIIEIAPILLANPKEQHYRFKLEKLPDQ